MGAPLEFDRSTRRIEELIFALDALADTAAADAARELLQRVLELHGAALARIMEAISAEPGGARLAALLASDDGVNGVLLLHGLHPEGFEARIRGALERLHPHLGVQGVVVQDLQIEADQVSLRLAFSGAGHLRSGDAEAIRQQVLQALHDAAPDATAIRVEGLPAGVSFVSVADITVSRRAGHAPAAAR